MIKYCHIFGVGLKGVLMIFYVNKKQHSILSICCIQELHKYVQKYRYKTSQIWTYFDLIHDSVGWLRGGEGVEPVLLGSVVTPPCKNTSSSFHRIAYLKGPTPKIVKTLLFE
jgi:hypothetical protein